MKLVKRPGEIVPLAAGTDDLVRDVVEILQRIAAQVLKLELESAEAADALNRRRLERDHDGSGDAEQLGRNARNDVAGRVTFRFALVDRLQRSEDESVVGRTAAGQREARDRERAKNVRIGEQDLFGFLGDVGRVGKRCARRRLYHHDEVVLIFLRHEAGGHMNVHVCCGSQSGNEQNNHYVAKLQSFGDGFAVAGSQAADRAINTVRERSVSARKPADSRPVKH